MLFTREAVFDKAASIRGAVQEITTIIGEFVSARQPIPVTPGGALSEIQMELNTIDRAATTMQEPDPAATLGERLAFLVALLDGPGIVHRSYVEEKITFALKPTRTVTHLRGALDSVNLATFEGILAAQR